MGRSYWFECPRCSYRAKVSGRADRGLHLFVQTIACRDCRELYDAVTRMRVSEEALAWAQPGGASRAKPLNLRRSLKDPPSFQSAMNRLARMGAKASQWIEFKLRCPVSAIHRVQAWDDPGRCPKCGVYLEKNALPFRIWD
jgi:hypothetical protein